MSFDIPPYLEKSIEDYATAQRISPDEAAVRIFQTGIEHLLPPVSPQDILGGLSSLEERETMDGALELAMKDREERNAKAPNAKAPYA